MRSVFIHPMAVLADIRRKRRLRDVLPIGPLPFIPEPYHIMGGAHISLSSDFAPHEGLRLEAITRWGGVSYEPRIVIGAGVSAGPHLHVGAIDCVTIGADVLIGGFVTIIDHNHGDPSGFSGKPPTVQPLTSKGGIYIGPRCWIGDKATILGGVTIGADCIIGANAVVTHSVPDGFVVGGNPARILRRRVSEMAAPTP